MMEKPKIKNVYLVAEMDNGDIRRIGDNPATKVIISTLVKELSSKGDLILLNPSFDLMLKSKCKKVGKWKNHQKQS